MNEGLTQRDSPGSDPGSDSLSPVHEEARQIRQVNTTKRLDQSGHLIVVVIVIVAAVALRLDKSIDNPTVSSVLIGALGYATGLTAGRAGNGKH